jgi:ubiquinone/menaquinone biosynthesis C-methylase UbiE
VLLAAVPAEAFTSSGVSTFGALTTRQHTKNHPSPVASSSHSVPLQMANKQKAAESVSIVLEKSIEDRLKCASGKLIQVAQQHPYGAAAAAAVVVGVGAKAYFDKPSRTYGDGTVAKEYDEWTQDGILEYYWGEHIHLGYYNKQEMEAGYKKKDFKQAKYDFVDEMMGLGGINALEDSEAKVLDVGCGFGGTSRYLAKTLGPKSQVTGITLSPKQVERGTELAKEQNLTKENVNFEVKDALKMDYEDNTFDIVWACESGEHMPDKKKYIEEMMRVLKPGGKFVMATWCQRDDRDKPFTDKDDRDLKFLYEEWYVLYCTVAKSEVHRITSRSYLSSVSQI